MPAQFYVLISNGNEELHQELGDEEMQEFLIQQASPEGVLYHTEMIEIKILYNTHTGEVKLVDVEKKNDVNFDYSNAFQAQRELVELAIRRLIKLELLSELYELNDEGICRVIRLNHDIDPATGKVISNTSEILLDMTLVKIIKLGYFTTQDVIFLRRLISNFIQKNQTRIQKAVYMAFENFKKLSGNGSKVLEEFKSKDSLKKFMSMIHQCLS
jgi:hypothetical protein